VWGKHTGLVQVSEKTQDKSVLSFGLSHIAWSVINRMPYANPDMDHLNHTWDFIHIRVQKETHGTLS